MNRAAISSLLVAAVVWAFPAPAWASVEGTWDVSGSSKVHVKIKGTPAQNDRQPAVDSFTFAPDGTFTMIDVSGTWTQNGRIFRVELDRSQVEALFEQEFAEQGYTVDVTVAESSIKGKESVDGQRIHGTLTMQLTLYIPVMARSGRVKATFLFDGQRRSTDSSRVVQLDAAAVRKIVERAARCLVERSSATD
jgi:hypothetical protein